MKKYLINFLIFLLIFVLPIIAIISSNLIEIKIFKEIIGLQDGSGMILIYILLAIISALCFSKFQDRIGFLGVAIPLVLFILIFISLFLYVNTIKFTIKLSPFYLSMIFGLVAGYFFIIKQKNRYRIPIILGIFPLLMSIGINELWVHKIEYGNWTGEVSKEIVVPFELISKTGELVNNKSLEGKIILFDF